jgi:hypothetical protein
MMTLQQAKERARLATVQLPTTGGQGVLVPGGFVLTAAHCTAWTISGGMALGDYCLEEIITPSGHNFRLEVSAIEPVSDVAALASPDDQLFYDDAAAFDAFCEATTPVRVSSTDFDVEVPVPVHILTPSGAWLHAQATRHGLPGALPGGTVWITPERGIASGSSGGPVIDAGGRLVGIVSWSRARVGAHDGRMARPRLALPVWVWRHIQAASPEGAH